MISFRKAPSAPVVILNLSGRRICLKNSDPVALDEEELTDADFDQIAAATERGLITNAAPPKPALPPINPEDVIRSVTTPSPSPFSENTLRYIEEAKRISTNPLPTPGISIVTMDEVADDNADAPPPPPPPSFDDEGIQIP